MTDLGEALALLHPLRGLAADEHERRALEVVEAAARNWQRLEELAHHDPHLMGIVDALTGQPTRKDVR